MFYVYPSKIRLLMDLVSAVASGLLFLWLGYLGLSHSSVITMEFWGGFFSCLLGLAVLTCALACLKWLILNEPSLAVNSDGIIVRGLFRSNPKVLWSDVVKISVNNEIEARSTANSSEVRAQYLVFQLSSKPKADWLRVPLYRMNESIETVIEKLKQIPQASALIDSKIMEFSQKNIGLLERLNSLHVIQALILVVGVIVLLAIKLGQSR